MKAYLNPYFFGLLMWSMFWMPAPAPAPAPAPKEGANDAK